MGSRNNFQIGVICSVQFLPFTTSSDVCETEAELALVDLTAVFQCWLDTLWGDPYTHCHKKQVICGRSEAFPVCNVECKSEKTKKILFLNKASSCKRYFVKDRRRTS